MCAAMLGMFPLFGSCRQFCSSIMCTCPRGHKFPFSRYLKRVRPPPGDVRLQLTGSWSHILPYLCSWTRMVATCLGRGVHGWIPAAPAPARDICASISSPLQATGSKCRPAGSASGLDSHFPLPGLPFSLVFEYLYLLCPSPTVTPPHFPSSISMVYPASRGLCLGQSTSTHQFVGWYT